MTNRCAKPAVSAKKPTDILIGEDRSSDRYFAPVIAALRLKFPKKLAQALAFHSGCDQRVCELWLEGKRCPGGKALVALLNSEIGDVVFFALTGGNEQPWLRRLKTQGSIASLKAEQKRLREAIALAEEDL